MIRLILIFVCFIVSAVNASVQVAVNSDKKLSCALEKSSFLSAKVKKNLTSGLPTKVVILVRLIELPSQLIEQRFFTIESKYDLWEEKFYVSNAATPKQAFTSQSDLEKLLEAPGPYALLPIGELNPKSKYKIEMVETLNPLDKEKFDSLQKWVTEQRVVLRGVSANPDSSLADVVPETAFTSLFYSLWKRASEGDSTTGESSRRDESSVFTVGSLK
jgi:hypothetical protein